jgi:hypothetical protein
MYEGKNGMKTKKNAKTRHTVNRCIQGVIHCPMLRVSGNLGP